jgi:vancomycin resistance protein YoaR
MEPEVPLSRPRSKKKKLFFIIPAVFILIMLMAATAFAYKTLQNDNIYKGVFIGNQNASGLSKDELKKLLDTEYQTVADKQEIMLKTEKAEIKARFPDFNVRYDILAAVEKAYAIGRTGTVFDRLYDIAHAGISGFSLNMPQTFDNAKVETFVNAFYSRTLVNVRDGALLITDSNVTLRSGIHGENIDKAKTLELVNALIKKDKSGTVEPEIIVTLPLKINIDDLYKQINSEPVDASYKIENSALTLIPHVVGRKIDKSQLEDIITELEKSEDTQRSLPVTFTNPNVTSEMAAAMLFKDELASWNTTFSTATTNGKNRGYNMQLAVSKINEMIMAPGQEFSYNEVVGPRDEAHGFKLAHVYSAGKIIDGMGGGICQVSSTMYSAILRADLEVDERLNHSFTVGYVPLGQDATAYYGGTDFKFKNSTKWPIKLLASVKGNKVYFSIKGTNDTPGKTVIISSKILQETPFTIKYTDDPTLPAGVTKEVLPGMNGYIVDTFKTVKMDGKVVSQTKLHTSRYKVYAQEMLRGTKGAVAAPAGQTATPPAITVPVETVLPPDDVEDEEAPPADSAAGTDDDVSPVIPDVPAP